MVSKDFFGKIDKVEGQRDSEWLRAGRYLLYIRKFFARERRDDGGKMAGFEFTVLKVLDPTPAAQEPKGPHHAGDLVTWGFMLNYDAAWAAMKSAIAAVMATAAAEVTPEVCLQCAQDDQPLSGIVVEVEGRVILTKKNERPLNRASIKRVVPAKEVFSLVDAEALKTYQIDFEILEKEATAG